MYSTKYEILSLDLVTELKSFYSKLVAGGDRFDDSGVEM